MYPDTFASYAEEALGMMGLMMGGYALTFGLSLGFTILLWILRSLGLFTAAQRRGIKSPWLAWIPLAELWILGSLSDQYHYVARGKVKNRRKWLIALVILQAVAWLGTMITVFVTVGKLFVEMVPMIEQGMVEMPPEMVYELVLPMTVASLVFSVLQLWGNILQWMCLHSFFASADPDNKTVYTVIGILISVTMPFFIFVCRNKDRGMPPRKDAAPAQPVAPAEIPAPVKAEAEEDPVNVNKVED